MGVVIENIFGDQNEVVFDSKTGKVVEVGTPRYFKIREEKCNEEAAKVAELAQAIAQQANATGTVSLTALERERKGLENLARAFRGDFEESDKAPETDCETN